ncbi:MAG TPA: bacteriohopanetetrol glucosamine biosynthesis glycosyltransferase HpnI [Xanthobacteraceae bacterium]
MGSNVTLVWASFLASVIAALGFVYLIAATILVRRFATTEAFLAPGSTPSITILKPLNGDEPGLLENLTSFCRQNYRGSIQIIFGVQDSNDRAIAVVEQLRKLKPAPAIDLVIETRAHGLNRKVSNLINMAQRIHHEIIVVADSDMRVDPDYLTRIVAALDRPGVGAVSCPYYGIPAAGVWSALFALGINGYFLPGALVGLALGLTQPCFGSTIALRRNTLAAIGGFAAVVDSIADDYAVGQALRAHGYTVSMLRFAVAHMCTTASAAELWGHEIRWGRTIRSIDPWGYAGSVMGYPLAWALIASLTSITAGSLRLAMTMAALSIAGRIVLLRQVERAFRLKAQAYWLVPLRDLFSFVVSVLSFFGNDVNWRGRSYRVEFGRGWVAQRRAHSP